MSRLSRRHIILTPPPSAPYSGWHNMAPQDCVDNGCVWRVPLDNWQPYCRHPMVGQSPGFEEPERAPEK